MKDRFIKILFSCAVSLYTALVCFNNLTDYPSNFKFVSMVARMEETFSRERNSWRSVNRVPVHHLLYLLIIFWEAAVAVFLMAGAIKMIRSFRAPAPDFRKAKGYTTLGLSLGVLLWFVVFLAIGGEWFLMWQSRNFNAQNTAFFLTCSFLLFLVYHNQQDS
jgi:predicted small integral membrane protein